MTSAGTTHFRNPRPWISSMRSRSASPMRIARRSSRDEAPPLRRITSSNDPQPITNSHNRNLKVMQNLENEYIRSLQQQIYLLELENNYIRQQAANAVDMQPAMIEEASKTITKVKELQNRIESLELELYRKEAHIGILEQKHNRVDQQLRENLLNHDKETDELKRQLMTLRGEREMALRDCLQKDAQMTELRNDLSRQKSSLAAAEVQLDLLRAKLENETAHVKDLEKALIDEKTQMLQMNSTLKQIELQYRQGLAKADVATNAEFQAKLERMQRQLSDCFLTAENERFIRDRQSADFDALVQENARLTADLISLKRQADETRTAMERIENRHNKELAELNTLRQREKDLLFANATLRQDLTVGNKRTSNLEKQLEKQERVYDQILARPNNQPQPPAVHMAQLEEDRRNLMNHIDSMQRELSRQSVKIDELQQAQQKQQRQQQLQLQQKYQQQHEQQYQRTSSPTVPPRSPLPSPRHQAFALHSPERIPSETRQSDSPIHYRSQTADVSNGQRGTSPVTRHGLRYEQ
ncbi:putative Centrosomal protein of 135 kDa [Fasciola hepatica]|uniref:Centrosomal protein of 135 kDa n=1 Tax=Fasciola hepatica TaxID=6192 RepID=A0A4E0R117_FASHE|nr:putative Centrosomal protein of 135 kDa [Fasciola hepatica]